MDELKGKRMNREFTKLGKMLQKIEAFHDCNAVEQISNQSFKNNRYGFKMSLQGTTRLTHFSSNVEESPTNLRSPVDSSMAVVPSSVSKTKGFGFGRNHIFQKKKLCYEAWTVREKEN